jgi:hypothetical protein
MSEGCLVWAAPSLLRARTYLMIALNMWGVSWESNRACVEASGRGAKCYPRGEYPGQILKIFILNKNDGNSIQWTSGYTGLA